MKLYKSLWFEDKMRWLPIIGSVLITPNYFQPNNTLVNSQHYWHSSSIIMSNADV